MHSLKYFPQDCSLFISLNLVVSHLFADNYYFQVFFFLSFPFFLDPPKGQSCSKRQGLERNWQDPQNTKMDYFSK